MQFYFFVKKPCQIIFLPYRKTYPEFQQKTCGNHMLQGRQTRGCHRCMCVVFMPRPKIIHIFASLFVPCPEVYVHPRYLVKFGASAYVHHLPRLPYPKFQLGHLSSQCAYGSHRFFWLKLGICCLLIWYKYYLVS